MCDEKFNLNFVKQNSWEYLEKKKFYKNFENKSSFLKKKFGNMNKVMNNVRISKYGWKSHRKVTYSSKFRNEWKQNTSWEKSRSVQNLNWSLPMSHGSSLQNIKQCQNNFQERKIPGNQKTPYLTMCPQRAFDELCSKSFWVSWNPWKWFQVSLHFQRRFWCWGPFEHLPTIVSTW